MYDIVMFGSSQVLSIAEPVLSAEGLIALPNRKVIRVFGGGNDVMVVDYRTEEGLELLPESKVYAEWCCVPGLPSLEFAEKFLEKLMRSTTETLILRFPNFSKNDRNGEGVLLNHGLRFAWSTWSLFPVKMGPDQYFELLLQIGERIREDCGKLFLFEMYPVSRLSSSDDEKIVPVPSPADALYYRPEFGPKPSFTLDPPVVSEYVLVVKFKEKDE